MGAEADVRAVAEGDVRIGRTAEVEAARGRSKTRSSWLAEAWKTTTLSPAADRLPGQLVSTVGGAAEAEDRRVAAQQFVDGACPGPTSPARSLRCSSGCSASARKPPGAALRTVSLPATVSRKKNISSSAPESSDCASEVMTSSAGCARLYAASSWA